MESFHNASWLRKIQKYHIHVMSEDTCLKLLSQIFIQIDNRKILSVDCVSSILVIPEDIPFVNSQNMSSLDNVYTKQKYNSEEH